MLGQPSQIFAEAEIAYRRDRLIADFPKKQFPKRSERRRLRLPTALLGRGQRPNRQRRHPRHVMAAPHHLTARI